MRFHFLAAVSFLLISCDRSSTNESDAIYQAPEGKTVVFEVPWDSTDTVRILWQRSYPEDYSELIRRAEQSRSGDDPFAVPIEVPDSELTPGDFGTIGWGRAIVPRVFDELGYPLGKDSEADYEAATGRFTITSSLAVIESFRERFPELKEIQSEQGSGGDP